MKAWKKRKEMRERNKGIVCGVGEARKKGGRERQGIGHTDVCGRENTPYIDLRMAVLFGVGGGSGLFHAKRKGKIEEEICGF